MERHFTEMLMNGDTERKERRLYPFEIKKEERRSGTDEERTGGKNSRRGGNSPVSIVRHSGKAPRERESYRDREGHKDGRRPGRYGQRPDGEHGTRAGGGHRSYEDMADDFSEALRLRVSKNTDIGTFLELPDGEKVLLPFSEQTERPAEGDEVTVYLFRDKGNRLTATMRRPILSVGDLGILRVSDSTRIGAFLDNGVPKEVLLPFRDQISSPRAGDEVLVYVYRDKSGRMAATMRVYKHLSTTDLYKEGDRVSGFVYEVNEKLGIFVAVDDRYFGMIPASEVYKRYRYGDRVEARVIRVREDGKLDLSPRERAYAAISSDAELILEKLREGDGFLPYADKADAALIEQVYGMSKNQFKRALGNLYKRRLVDIDREKDTVRLL